MALFSECTRAVYRSWNNFPLGTDNCLCTYFICSCLLPEREEIIVSRERAEHGRSSIALGWWYSGMTARFHPEAGPLLAVKFHSSWLISKLQKDSPLWPLPPSTPRLEK